MTERLSGIYENEVIFGAREGESAAVASVMTKATGLEQERGLARLLSDYYLTTSLTVPDDTRALLIQKLSHDGLDKISEPDLMRVCLLLQGIDLHKQLDCVDSVLKKYLYPKIAASEQFSNALSQWNSWDNAKRMAYGKFFVREFCLIAKIPEADLKTMTLPRDEQGFLTAGRCTLLDKGHVCVEINDAEPAPLNNMRAFHGTLYHELVHGIQVFISHCIKNGETADISPELKTAGLFMSVMMHPRVYAHALTKQEVYQGLSIEDHAENNAQDFVTTLHDEKERAALMQKAAQIQNSVAGRTSTLRQGAVQS